ncbi:MAG: Holliday junction branch migration protein RuvA [Tepidisphaeraceae bacterium]
MIASVTGQLASVSDGRAQLQLGPFVVEVLVPAADVAELEAQVGLELTLHTLMYLEGDPNRGNLEPRLLGFLRLEDKKFFELFTTVKGIGPKTALRALTVPVGQIASAVESKDARFLVGLDGIGKRTAELIIAELAGKVGQFVTEHTPVAPVISRRSRAEEDAIALMVAGGEKRADAERLLERVKRENPTFSRTEEFWQEMLRQRA